MGPARRRPSRLTDPARVAEVVLGLTDSVIMPGSAVFDGSRTRGVVVAESPLMTPTRQLVVTSTVTQAAVPACLALGLPWPGATALHQAHESIFLTTVLRVGRRFGHFDRAGLDRGTHDSWQPASSALLSDHRALAVFCPTGERVEGGHRPSISDPTRALTTSPAQHASSPRTGPPFAAHPCRETLRSG